MSQWRSMKTLPNDTFVLLGMWIYPDNIKSQSIYCVAKYNSKKDCFYERHCDLSLPWNKRDFDFWMPIPELPPVEGPE